MSHGNVILRFENVSYHYHEDKPILEEVNFSIRDNAKITIMGQNGAGKSTIFKLITNTIQPTSGSVHIIPGKTIGIAPQVMPKEYMQDTILEYFAHAFTEKKYNLEKLVRDVLEVVHLTIPLEKKIQALSGGQQARLLLAFALIQDPDILLLDEPTNNLDQDGIDHLTTFLIMYPKTVLVISHDAYFLNSFTDGVVYLDARTKKVDQYVGTYLDVVEEIKAQVERDERKNAQLLKNIQDRKEKVNFFANKGGKMRKLAAKLKEEIAEDEENMVDVRQEDRTIQSFTIPAQEWSDTMAKIQNVTLMKHGDIKSVPVDIELRRKRRLLIKGPNGIGKSTLLQSLASGTDGGMTITPGVRVGYYRQDFSGLDFNQTVYQSLADKMGVIDNEEIFATGAQFLLHSSLMKNTVGSLSEGQKGLLCYAQFVLEKPGLLILDEPTNHINFRHLPLIAQAIDEFQGAVILVSHMPEFVEQIHITDELDLGRF